MVQQVSIRRAIEADFHSDFLKAMFADSYKIFEGLLGRSMLRDGAFDQWARNYDKTQDRSRIVLILISGESPIGFAEGVLRTAPATAPPEMMGFVAHIFVDSNHRRGGNAARLYAALEEWFVARGVNSIELQVVRGNDNAMAFWNGQRFATELVTMRKELEKND